MDSAVTAIVGGLILLMLGWLKLDIMRLADKIERLEGKVQDLSDRVSRIEGHIDREHH